MKFEFQNRKRYELVRNFIDQPEFASLRIERFQNRKRYELVRNSRPFRVRHLAPLNRLLENLSKSAKSSKKIFQISSSKFQKVNTFSRPDAICYF